jgi:hypothetical protein
MAISPVFWRIDEFVKAANGPALAGAEIFFAIQPANTASYPPTPLVQLYADPFGITPITQPLIADGFGHVSAYVAAGTYTEVVAINNINQLVYPDQSYGVSSASTVFETNGIPNSNQGLLNLVGSGDITITQNILGQTVVESTGVILPGTGNGPLLVTANAGVTTAPAGDILTADGLGNAQDSGIQVSSISLLAPQANPTFTGLITGAAQTLSGTATFNGDAKIGAQMELPYNQTIVLSGSGDSYSGLIQNAINAMSPTAGGTVDARALGVSLVAQGAVAPTAGITILLGPHTYTFTSITLAENLQIIGAGAQSGGSIIKCSALTTTALFFGPGAANPVVGGCLFEGFAVYGPSGSTSSPAIQNFLHCFFLDASGSASTSDGGVWNSVWRHLQVYGFGGTNFYLKGGGLGFHQYNSFYDILMYTNVGTIGHPSGQSVRIEGTNYQHNFYNLSMQGPNGNGAIDTTSGLQPLLLIGGGANTLSFPYGMQFYGCNINGREVMVQIDGGQDILIQKTHSEQCYTWLKITSGLVGSPLNISGVVVRDCSFNANVGINAGGGSVIDFDASSAGNVYGVKMEGCVWNDNGGAVSGPDAWVLNNPGAPNYITSENWTFGNSLLLQAGAGGQCATVVATKHLTAQAASIAPTAWFTPTVSGLYRFSGSVTCTTAASSGSGQTASWGIAGYTNQAGTGSQNPVGTPTPVSVGELTYENSGSVTVYCTQGDSVSYLTTLSSVTGAPKYALNIIAEYLG